jgi:hypothetical protein
LGLALTGCEAAALAATGAFVWVVAALGLGACFADAERGGKRLPRFPPGRVSVEALVACGRCDAGGADRLCKPTEFGTGVWVEAAGLEVCRCSLEALPCVGKVAAAFVEAGTSAGSDPQSESTSSVLGADAAPSACDLPGGAACVFGASGEFDFGDSLDNAGGSAAAGAAGLDC